jgi:hypothetical protein
MGHWESSTCSLWWISRQKRSRYPSLYDSTKHTSLLLLFADHRPSSNCGLWSGLRNITPRYADTPCPILVFCGTGSETAHRSSPRDVLTRDPQNPCFVGTDYGRPVITRNVLTAIPRSLFCGDGIGPVRAGPLAPESFIGILAASRWSGMYALGRFYVLYSLAK